MSDILRDTSTSSVCYVNNKYSKVLKLSRSVWQTHLKLWPLPDALRSFLLAAIVTLWPRPLTPPARRGQSVSSVSVCPRAVTVTQTLRTPTASVQFPVTSVRTAPVSLPSLPAVTVTPPPPPPPPPAPQARSVSSAGVSRLVVTVTPPPRILTASARLVSSAGTASVRDLSPRAVTATRSLTTRTISAQINWGVSAASVRTVHSLAVRPGGREGTATRSSTLRSSS